MKLKKHHGQYGITARTSAVKYIVCHYTEGPHKAGSAENNCIYFAGGDRGASAHYFVDDGGVWEYADPSVYYTWHCGDGHGKNGISNANSIGIEVCQDGDVPYTEAEIRYLTELVVYLMAKFGVTADHVVRHYDASGKICPKYYAKRDDEWKKLRKTITGQRATTTCTWEKDSSGWRCYGDDGVALKNKWVLYKNVWYYLKSNGYMAANEWAKDSTGKWCYLSASGAMLTNGWAKDSKGWYWMGSDGYMVKRKWIQYKGGWYYLTADGLMATGTYSVPHTFNGGGKCVK